MRVSTILLEICRAITCLAVGYGAFMIGMAGVLPFCWGPSEGCGLPLVAPMMLGGLGGVLAFRQGVFKQALLPGTRLAIVTLAVGGGTLAMLFLVARTVVAGKLTWTEIEFGFRLFGAAITLGAVDGALGGWLGSLLWPRSPVNLELPIDLNPR